MGVAYDSLVQVLTVAGTVAIVLAILCLVSRHRTPAKERGPLKRMPLLLPAFAFVFAILVSYQILPLPISAYRGGNEVQFLFPNERSVELEVIDAGEIYFNRIEAYAGMQLGPDESLRVDLEIYDGSTLVDMMTLNLYPPPTWMYVEDEDSSSMSPGLYNISVACTFLEDGIPQVEEPYVAIRLSQPTRPEMIQELVNWSSYQFFLNIASVAFVMLGLCLGSEEKTRRRATAYDEEPPREGEVYGRKY